MLMLTKIVQRYSLVVLLCKVYRVKL